MTDDLVLEVKNLNAFYTNTGSLFARRKRVQALYDVSFSLRAGEVLGLVGESGCGKSTLAKTILGMVPDHTGEIIHYTRRPQMIFQDPYSSLNPAKTIGWMLDEPMMLHGKYDKQQRWKRVEDMLESVGLPKDTPTAILTSSRRPAPACEHRPGPYRPARLVIADVAFPLWLDLKAQICIC
jgi:peptide/nickel transport system ATP-binding protein